MARRRSIRSTVREMIGGAMDAGLAPDQFEIVHNDGVTRLLPRSRVDVSGEDDIARRMREAFGIDDGAPAIRS